MRNPMRKFGLRGLDRVSSLFPPLPKGIVFKGDSLTAGFLLETGDNFPEYVQRIFDIPTRQNYAVSGQRVDTANSNYATEGGTAYNAATADTYCFMMGTNDSNQGADASTVLSRIQTHLNLAKATGYRIILGSIPKRGDNSGVDAVNATVNASLRANWKSMGATWFFDLGTLSTLQNPADTTYFQGDLLHFTALGAGEVAKSVGAAINATPLALHAANGAPRFRAYPTNWMPTNAITQYSNSMMSTAVPTYGGSVLGNPVLAPQITAKSVFAVQFPTLSDFTGIGVRIVGETQFAGMSGSVGPAYYNNGNVVINGTTRTTGAALSAGDTVGVAVDPIAKQIWWTKDGTNWVGVDSTATTAQVAAGVGSTAQTWSAGVFAALATWNGTGFTANSVPYPWTKPTGYVQL